MAYMIFQQYTTAILEAYRDAPDVSEHLARARAFRRWLESLAIEAKVKDSLVEQAKVIEAAFARLVD